MDDRRFFPNEPPYVGKSFLRPNGSIKFDPILTDQRYSFVINLLSNDYWKQRVKKVADFGCADLSFFRVLRSLRFLETAYLVDIDEDLLKNNRFRAQPINHDFIDKREHPFHVEVLRGSVDVFSEKMRHLDAFVAIELIEHLYPLELERLPYNVFHLIKPQIAIFTTPNSDFNVLFASLPAHNFRHDDHKFEWSREQFREWAENLAQRFPDYSVSIQGIGPAPEGSEDHGCCSQAAVFVRNTESSTEVEADDILNYNREAVVKTYEVVMECDFPFDQRSKEQKIGDLAMYHINLMEHRARMDREFDCDELKVEIPLQKIISFVLKEYSTTLEELECILKERKVEIRDQTVIVESDEEYSNEDEEMY